MHIFEECIKTIILQLKTDNILRIVLRFVTKSCCNRLRRAAEDKKKQLANENQTKEETQGLDFLFPLDAFFIPSAGFRLLAHLVFAVAEN